MMGDEHGYLMAEQTATASELPKYPSNVFSARFRLWVLIQSDRVDLNALSITQGVVSRNIAIKHLWGQ